MTREEIQQQALDTLISNKRAGIAVSMGVGKTLIGLRHIEANYYEGLKVLVVAPKKSILKSWKDEAKKFVKLKKELVKCLDYLNAELNNAK